MTICISVKVPEGLVLAADSLSAVMGPNSVLQLFEHAQKVNQLRDYPIGTLNWGAGTVSQRTIDSIIAEFSESLPPLSSINNLDVKAVAEDLCEFIKEKYDNHFGISEETPLPDLGVLVGGFSTKSFFAEVYAFQFPATCEPLNQIPDNVDGTAQFGANWYGMTDSLMRLWNGADVRIVQEVLGDNFTIEALQNIYAKYGYGVLFHLMPLQDAIDFAMYLANVVVGAQRFSIGMPLCGGNIDIAVITRNEFRWLKRKTWKAGP